MLDDASLARYSRQMLVPEIDLDGQQRLAAATVLIVGCGGLGCPAALYLGGAGVGCLRLCDDDLVEISNLPRQVAFGEQDAGHPKAGRLAEAVRARNSTIAVEEHQCRFDSSTAAALLADVDLVIDASDNVSTRLAIEKATRDAGTPWVMAGVIQGSSMWVAFDGDRQHGCYECLSPESVATQGCAELGVLGPVVGLAALMQSVFAIRYLAGAQTLNWGKLTINDWLSGEAHTLSLSPCAKCSSR